jgi:hypothetical protein
LGCLAEKAGVGKKIEWDAQAMKAKNMPELDPMIRRTYRKEWSI